MEIDEIDGVTFNSFVSVEQLDNFVDKELSSKLNGLTTDSLHGIEQEELLPSICPSTTRVHQVKDTGH